MEVLIPSNQNDQFKKRLKEGWLYTLKSFIDINVQQKKYRTSQHIESKLLNAQRYMKLSQSLRTSLCFHIEQSLLES
jgi:hypothetical protein